MTIYLSSGVGQVFSVIHFFFALGLLTVVDNAKNLGLSHKSERFLQNLPEYEVVHPTRVDDKGHFLSNFLSHHGSRIQRREVPEEPRGLERVFYQLRHGGHSLHFNLSLNSHLLAPGFLMERRYGGLEGAQIHSPSGSQCHFLGEVWEESSVKGMAAISTCDGLTGLFRLSDEEFFIQPLEQAAVDSTKAQAHLIAKRHTTVTRSDTVLPISRTHPYNSTCGVKDLHGGFEDAERQRERWEGRRRAQRSKRVHQRSVTTEKWVETLVVADHKMVEYHGSKGVESYVLAVMNIVSGLFQDASIGNSINIVVVRLILLEQEEEDLKITHHADSSLSSFCKWQKGLNMKGDEHPLHHDVAVLLTRKDICTSINKPCETLGLSHVAGMCQPHRSCSINEDTGLPLAFTVAHELGHNFGIQHDGSGNDCEPIGKRPFVMSPQLLYGTSLPSWSRCSRQYITRFLDRGWGWCLDDPPVRNELSLSPMPPGVLYSAAHQCRLQHGSLSLLCDDVDNVCNTLWCTVGTTCHSKMDGAVDGTSCGEGKWCFNGECVKAGYRPERVNGGWSAWSEWSSCSRTCGVGVLSAHRDCVNPVPKYGGKYCLGERRRYRTCNRVPCLSDHPTFRDTQCSNFNTLAYKGRFHKWVAVNNRDNACELHCRPLNEHFSEKMLDAVADGTRCHEGNSSRDMCINGVCKNVGCDFVIDSSAGEDRCGVCQGDGSTCKTVTKTFEESEGLGYVDIGLIPKGARNIRVEELAEAGNFLALRSDNPDKYFLNGGWTIQWNGDYKAAGTIFTYERTGHLENLTSLGPTNEPLWIQLLFQETNPGVRYEYTISQALSEDNNTAVSDFFWKTGAWTECSASCGIGIQRQTVHCVERTFGIVEEHFCNPLTRPDNKQTTCHKELCPPIWWTGEWQRCSSSCGLTGMTKRTVLCIQAVDVEERRALQHAECKHMSKPEFVSSCNTHIPCPADWISGSWSDCSLTCGSGIRCRNVSCSWNTGVVCDPQRKPAETASCHLQDCPVVDDHFGAEDWSGSGWNSKEVINEINSLPEVNLAPKQSNIRAQPRTHNDLYNIIDADFTHHNHIEKTNRPSEKNIKVDDFYYDYNFINFHEDLSYDFDSEDNARQAGDDEVSTPKEHGENLTTEENISGKTPTTTSASFTMKTNDLIENSVKTRSSKPTSDLDDLPDDDYFLPVPTSPSVPVFPRDLSTLPSLEVNKNESTRLEKHEVEAKIANADHIKEDDDVTGTLHQFTHTQPNEGESVTSAEQIEDADYFEYYYSRKSTVGPDIYGSQGAHTNTESPLGLPSGENGAARPITSRSFDLSMLRPTAFIPEDTDVDSAGPFRVISAQTISGNQDTSAVTSSVTATHTFPPTELESGPRPPTWPTLTTSRPESTVELQTPRQPAVIGGTEPTISTPQAPSSYDWPEVDDNDIFIHPMLRTTGDIHPSPQRQHPLSNTVSPTHTLTEMVNVPSLPSDPLTVWPVPGLSSLPSPASTQVTAAAHWVVGNWSSCSTSCGLGATWRSLACSTGKESECNPAKRPAPARRCYLRPCSAWNIGEWSKCSKNCGGGVTSREVQCYDMRDQRPLRPFHCRAISSRPHAHSPCNIQPCLEWYTSSWGQCSEVCSGGQQQRLVTCPEEGHCDKDLLPSNIQPCNSHPCVQWLTGSWGQCSALCGGGVQHRLIKCVDTKADTEQEVDHSQCGHQPRPHDTSKCNLHECESAPSGIACLRDRLSFHFCQTLQWLGRCRLPTVHAQCCKTCNQGSRGNGPTSHR